VAQPVKTSLLSGTDVPMERILAFAGRVYGRNAHQAMASFYQWEYTENPNCPNGLGSMIVAVDGSQQVVGFINRVYLTWDVRGEQVTIPALVDFAVDDAHRQGGVGLRLILKSTSDLGHAFINGSNPNSAPVFRSLKYQELEGGQWFRKILSPLRGGLRYALHKIGGGVPASPLRFAQWASSTAHLSAAPDDALLRQLANLLNDGPAQVKPFWTVETLRWRFFHPLGPRHLLIHRSFSDGTMSAALLISCGPVRGLNACRVIAHGCTDPQQFRDLLSEALRMAEGSGVDVFFAFTFERSEADVLAAMGFAEQPRTPNAFFFHKRRKDAELFRSVLVQGAASDLGFEAVGR
jgi:hypothetical protein